MPKITKVERAGGRVVYRFTLSLGPDPVTGNRRQRVYTYDDPKEAERERDRMCGQLVEGRYTDRNTKTVSDALDAYLESVCYGLADSTRVSYAGALLPVRDRLGRRKLQSITKADIEHLRDWLETGGRRRGGTAGTPLGDRSVALTLAQLKAAFKQACQEGWLARNPAEYVKMPKLAKRERPTWSEGELRAFATVAAGDRLAACWRLSILGVRRGEVLGLRWSDVDLSGDCDAPHGRVTIGRARVLVYGRPVEKSPKSERGWRTLPVPDTDTAAALTALQVAQLDEQEAAGPAYAGGGGAYVACDQLGAPLHPAYYSDTFAGCARRPGCR